MGNKAGLFDKTKGIAASVHAAMQCLCVSTLPPMWATIRLKKKITVTIVEQTISPRCITYDMYLVFHTREMKGVTLNIGKSSETNASTFLEGVTDLF